MTAAETRAAITLAHRLGVAGVVASQLAPLDQAWQSTLSENLARNLYLQERSRTAIRALAAAGVPCLVLKGLPLSRFAYGSIAIRQCADIDVLVPPERMVGAVEALATEGFQSPVPVAKIAEVGVRHVGAVALLPAGAESQYALDLHGSIPLPVPLSGSISGDWLERFAEQTPVSGDLPSVGGAEMCLHSIVHWHQHGPLLKTLTDMAACRHRGGEAWSAAMDKAERDGWGEIARTGEREAAAFVNGRPSTLPLRIGATRQLLREPGSLAFAEVFAARSLVSGQPRAVLIAAGRELWRGFRAEKGTSRPRRRQLHRALTRPIRGLWILARFTIGLSRS